MSQGFEYFKKADVLLNAILQQMFGVDSVDRCLAVAVTNTVDSNGDEAVIPLNAGADWIDLLMDETMAMVVSHFSRFGVVAPAQMAVRAKDEEWPESELEMEYEATVFICWWDGVIYSSTRLKRPEGCGDELSPAGIPYGVPQFSEVGHDGALAEGLSVLAEASRMLRVG